MFRCMLPLLVSVGLLVGITMTGEFVRAETPSDTWSQWRGPHRTGEVAGPKWPDSLDEKHLVQLWTVPLGPSYSGPIVDGQTVFVTETKDKKNEVVHALNTETGESRWTATWEGSMSVPFFAASNGSWIRATPASDGESLYVAGMRDVLVCLDLKTGEQRWRVDFVERFKSPLPAFGFVSSPLIDGDAVYVQAGASFVKLDKRTGETIWRCLDDGGGMFGSAFSSPVFAKVNNVPQLLVQTRQKLAGVDPEAGKVLWTRDVEAFRGMNILTPTVVGDAIFTSAYGGKSLLVRVGTAEKSDAGLDAQEVWTNKAQAYMSSPVVIGNHVYVHLRNRRFTCIDLTSGESTWTTEPFGEYWSMVVQGDRILALDSSGTLRLIQADPSEFKLIDSRKVSDNSWAHVGLQGDRVYVRGIDALTAYRWQP
jgi:outer membrane protein assembly factor BamB